MNTRGTTDEYPLLLATLPPTAGQRRLAFAIVMAFVAAFVITVPVANTPLPRVDAWVPAFTSALVINDFVTAALLFSQFMVARQRALLVLAAGYLFSGLIIIPYGLTFPGVFAPTGLLGAGLQSAVWLYIVWHVASPLSVIVYQVLKRTSNKPSVPQGSARREIVLGAVAVVAAVCVITWLVTALHDFLPELYRDGITLNYLVRFAAGLVFLTCAAALALLWIRGDSVLDLWLMVTVSAWLLEIALQGVMLTDRFSLAWYMGRIYSLVASGVVLTVLLSEMTTLYAHLARSVLRQRAAGQARQIAVDTMAASIAHEVNQPLGAIALNAETALLHLARTPPDHAEVRDALEDIATASARGVQVIASLRAMFKQGDHQRTMFDLNDLLREVVALLNINLLAQRVSVSTALRDDLPRLLADRSQLRQVFMNLVTNAIEAMNATDRARLLRITSNVVPESSDLRITIEDSGAGIDLKDNDRIFEPFFTTKSTGTGIGLTICRSVIDSHGGILRASANSPYGTIVEVVVPVASA